MNQIDKKDYSTRSQARLENRVKRLLAELSPDQDFSKKSKILLEILELTPKGRMWRSRLLTGYTASLRPTAEAALSELCVKLIAEYSNFHQLPLVLA